MSISTEVIEHAGWELRKLLPSLLPSLDGNTPIELSLCALASPHAAAPLKVADGYGPGDGGGRGGGEKAACPAVAIGETYARSNHERRSECRFEYATFVLR